MPLLSLARPIENAASAEEARVLAVIDHLMPILGDWRQGKDLRRELGEVENQIAAVKQRYGAVSQALAAATGQATAAANSIAPFKWSAMAVLAAGAALSFFLPWWVGIATASIGIGLGYRAKVLTDLARQRSKAQQQAEAEAAQLDTQYKGLDSRNRAILDELKQRGNGFPEVKLAAVRFGVQMSNVAGRNVLLDESGVHPLTALKTVDVSALQAGLMHISEHVQGLLQVPPLLSPDSEVEADDPVNQLFGEESQISELVTEFTQNLGKLRDIELKLPLVSPASSLVQRLGAGALDAAAEGPSILMSNGVTSPEEIQSFVAKVNRSREQGRRVFDELAEVFKNLESICNLYAQARTASINTIHHSLLEVLQRATWCNRRFYCARTILSPRYVQDLLGIDMPKAYLLSLDDLFGRLRGDAEIARRLEAKRELETELSDAYFAVQDFMGNVSFNAHGQRMEEGQRPRHVEDQFRESLRHFTNVLQKVMTGASHPVLNFSAEAILHYDPESDEWSSGISPYVYSTADALRYGSVVKAYSELMIPLWEHLWTEKSDFRKTEMFRTNDSMILMSEKESEKLIDIANQFRDDLRSVRQNVNVLESELKSKCGEIIGFRDEMDQLGLLSDRAKLSISEEKLRQLMSSESISGISGRYEAQLGMLPRQQAENRGGVQDPIDLVREPDSLVTLQEQAGVRLLSV